MGKIPENVRSYLDACQALEGIQAVGESSPSLWHDRAIVAACLLAVRTPEEMYAWIQEGLQELDLESLVVHQRETLFTKLCSLVACMVGPESANKVRALEEPERLEAALDFLPPSLEDGAADFENPLDYKASLALDAMRSILKTILNPMPALVH